MSRFIFLSLFLFLISSQEILAQAEVLEVQQSTRLLIIGKKGSLNFKGSQFDKIKKNSKIELSLVNSSGDQRSLSSYCEVKKSISLIVLNCSDLGSVGGLILKFLGPSLPLEVHWQNGQHVFANWSSDLSVVQKSGSVLIEGGKGLLKLNQNRGKVQVNSYSGSLNGEFYSANFEAKNFKGDAVVNNFSGKIQFIDSQGDMVFKSYSGKSFVQNSSGSLNFEHHLASLNIQGFKGRLKGQSGQGSVVGQNLKINSAHIRTKEGLVKLSRVGGRANLGTVKGSIQAPLGLKFTQLSNLKLMSGTFSKTSLGIPKGYIYVRTESGNIKLQ